MGWRTHFVQETHCFVQPLCSLCASTVCFSYLKKHKIHMKTTTPWINGYGLKWPALCGILWASGTLQFCYAIPISSHDITTILGSVPITILLCFLTYIVSIYIVTILDPLLSQLLLQSWLDPWYHHDGYPMWFRSGEQQSKPRLVDDCMGLYYPIYIYT